MKTSFRRPTGPQLAHGAQLAVAVSVSYAVSAVIGLPENFWAVMTALIVVRPNTGATVGAGWDRVRGTVFGTLFGLAGVWARHRGLGTPASTLAIIAALAFASALLPAMRAAPIAALIVLTSAGIAGHSALLVAGLRVAEIAIGVVTGLAVTLLAPGSRAEARFDRECAALLRRAAAGLVLPPPASTIEQREATAEARRAAVRELVILGIAADRESRLPWRRTGRKREAGVHQRVARLVSRTTQDAELVTRLFETMVQRQADPAWARVAAAAATALSDVADALERPGAPHPLPLPSLDALRGLARGGDGPVAPLLAGPAALLARDLAGLARHASAGASAT